MSSIILSNCRRSLNTVSAIAPSLAIVWRPGLRDQKFKLPTEKHEPVKFLQPWEIRNGRHWPFLHYRCWLIRSNCPCLKRAYATGFQLPTLFTYSSILPYKGLAKRRNFYRIIIVPLLMSVPTVRVQLVLLTALPMKLHSSQSSNHFLI